MAKQKTKRRSRPKLEPVIAPAVRAEYLTPTEVAQRLLVATVTVRLWASKGLLPSVTTLGGHRRFLAADVDAFVAHHQQARTHYRAPPKRVLIIDDDEYFSQHLARLIIASSSGVVVDVANDGFSAGLKCEALRPDVVTLDLQMPTMDGYEVCAMLRAMFGKTKPRIVALTAFASRKNIARIIAAGADCCVAKTTAAATLLQQMGLARTPPQ